MDTIGALGEAAEKPSAEIREQDPNRSDPDKDVEIILLAAAGAIQRLIAELSALRSRTAAQELELMRFQRRSALIHDSYRRLTTEFVSQFQLIDNAVSNFVREPTGTGGADVVEPKYGRASPLGS